MVAWTDDGRLADDRVSDVYFPKMAHPNTVLWAMDSLALPVLDS